MNLRKEYITVIIAYFLVVLYVIFDNNLFITILLITGLLIYQIFVTINVNKSLSEDKETSVSKLLTRLDKTKKEKEESYKRFLSLSTHLGSGLLMVDDEGLIQLANKDINEYFQRDFNNTDYQKHSDLKSFFKFVNQAYLLESSLRAQIKHNEKVYDLISTPLFEEDMFKGALILVHDITLIQNAEKYQKRFTADVSHELRTPLSAIKGFSEILLRDEEISSEDKIEFLNLIYQESYRMETILTDLMVISKMDRIDYELEMSHIDIKDLIKECIAVLKSAIKEKGLTIEYDVISQVIKVDKVKMSQVILNILKNAMNYTDNGGIVVHTSLENNSYVINITDTGIGIKEDKYDKIFKRFYRVDKARSRDTGGSGLGLSISKNVVHKHGGSITVSSVLDQGTTFSIKLPINE